MAWAIEYTESARRQLRKLDRQNAQRILDYMDQRVAASADPRTLGRALKGPLGEFWRYRVGAFRIICELKDAALVVVVIRIGDRKEVYR